jgi:antitoxin-like ribbon-helix-helix protein
MASRKDRAGRAGASSRRPPDPARDGEAGARRKLIAFEPEMLQALTLLARDRMQSFQEIADEAFVDLLKKHGRPVDLKQALRESVGGDRTTGRPRRVKS